ncbi:TPA: hypothetical protein N2902_003691 [Vibrio parahaemolyticus]|uniref:hypothetical protein n=2 Tax=Vibrio parahaemolyticus TaxID=670 RepID=UPI000B785CDC|nr:hypothetical protein [Vibrio parahaemolyticus]MBE4445848.1 hypothetical protein [Vibrio parahaemolyticus]MDF5667951.1 hypothetical protein [Vibrio parahaemolyticus]OXD33303.1 hypothetical protein CA162_13045 [Vibrio parahaemolyticus]TOM78961.1 hypothetical protein CGH70_22675 [Vibrio parahaemolyticus]HBH7915268.1 hypothetical protein [Vibrio parahaemolyticus]
MKRKAFALTMLALASTASNADEFNSGDVGVIGVDWGFNEETQIASTAIMKPDENGGFKGMSSSISLSAAGEKRIYLSVMDKSYNCNEDPNFSSKTKDDEKEGNLIWKINGSFVKMYAYCAKDGFINATPSTGAGERFTVGEFMKSNKSVRVTATSKGLNLSADVSAVGFTKTWNEFGGDAL